MRNIICQGASACALSIFTYWVRNVFESITAGADGLILGSAYDITTVHGNDGITVPDAF